jgi:hypothetical protein
MAISKMLQDALQMLPFTRLVYVFVIITTFAFLMSLTSVLMEDFIRRISDG